jgi:hypothetical protein
MVLLKRSPVSTKEAILSKDVLTTAAIHIDIPGDVLIPDGEFCDVVLGGTTRRTALRYERDGLPFVMISNRKFRPLNAGREWLARRIQAVAYRPQRRRRASKPKTLETQESA